MTEYRFAEEGDLPALKRLWMEAFDDSEAYVDLFYKGACMKTYVAMHQGRVAAAVHMLPYTLVHKSASTQMMHLYAVSVDAPLRGHGIMTEMLQQIIVNCQAACTGISLRPANDRLRAYYSRQGFKEMFFLDEVQMEPGIHNEIGVQPLSAQAFYQRRNAFFCRNGFACWNLQQVTYAVSENAFFGGCLWNIRFHERDYFLLGQKQGDVLLVIETDMDAEALQGCAWGICKAYAAKKLVARLRADTVLHSGYLAGMTYGAPSVQGAYFNLILA